MSRQKKGSRSPTKLIYAQDTLGNSRGVALPHIVDDYTGTKLRRPGLDTLRKMLVAGQAEGVVCMRSDRLTRMVAHSIILREEFARYGIELHFVNRGQSQNTPEGQMTDNIEAVFNQFWRDKIVEDTDRGRWEKARQGKIVCCGRPPYGYYYKDDQLVIIDEEAAVVRRIFKSFCNGSSIKSICDTLKGIPTPGETRGKKHTVLPNGTWRDFTVYTILAREAYCGVWRYGKRNSRAKGKGKTYRPDEETIPVSCPSIVSRQEWVQARARLEQNKLLSKRNTKWQYLLRGMLRCGECQVGFRGEYHKTQKSKTLRLLSHGYQPRLSKMSARQTRWRMVR
ncbi:MAG: recombinase family protein [Anaerolineae bacterium]|nr:recombinase family protein [Anaerolineae bacterium]